MGSPVSLAFSSFITIERQSATPVYLQIAQQVTNAIQRGYLPVGTKLPGTRLLSLQLQVHRKTAIAAAAELEAQGWLQLVPNKGTYVVSKQALVKLQRPKQNMPLLNSYPVQTGYSVKQSQILDAPFEYQNCTYYFTDGTPDVRLTAIKELSGMYTASMTRRRTLSKLQYHSADTDQYFKRQLSNYLNLTRGLRISPANLLCTSSKEMGLYLIAQLLLSAGDTVVVGELGHFGANMVFQNAGASLKTIPVDEEGICTDHLAKLCERTTVRMVYVNSQHHYPTTVTLGASRRMELLNLAGKYGFIIIEDDHDFEFQYGRSVSMPLASADNNGMVVYLGTFGNSLAPGFRTGFIVAPQNLIHELQKHLLLMDKKENVIAELVLGEMIEEGNIHRHLKKTLKIYQQRRDALCQILEDNFKDTVSFTKPDGGLALWSVWSTQNSLLDVSRKCAAKGLFIPKTLLYQNKKLTAMRIGFGHMDETEMKSSLEILKGSML
ncbi:PLP-dependent aminotransferase family protein [Mucilaginibacter pallidiroseus]|uniref:PLP-dependent aminotransferase family protein n=1 Tax=Mucilaginibacter pallidiroseus TaxID=2599295 RepID=A0A563UJG5_9SPHI|nr:PLP-dependent aminotransferase family protein [Mucilaginibacter pallidiroseus]TWR31428.1 PLP-dependent aminotransferase family protein [Mucilaginibacter pallidiroseus]